MKNKIVVECQKDVKDCGACCLSSIVKFYGGYVPLEKIRLDTYTSYDGVSVYNILKAAEKYGFDACAKKIQDKDLSKIILPAIVHVIYKNGLTHFMCLYKINGDEYVLMDPSKGKVKMKKSEFDKIFSQVVIEFCVRDKILLLEKGSNIYSLFVKIIIANKKLCINVLLTSILLMILTILNTLYFKVMNQYVTTNKDQMLIKFIVLIFLIILLFKIIFEYLKSYYENHINKNIDVSVFKNFINHLFYLPYNVICFRTTGEIMTRVNELQSIKNLFSEIFVTCFLDFFITFGAFISLCIINVKMTFILSLFVIIYVIFSLLLNPYIYKRIRKNIEYQTESNNVIIENIDMISSIKNLDETSNVLNKIESKMSSLIFDNYTFTNDINFFNTFKNIIYELAFFIVNTYGFYLIYASRLTIIDLIMFNSLMSYYLSPIKNLIDLLPKYNFLRASFNKICDFIDLEEEKKGLIEPFTNGDITFKNVCFSYNNYKKIVDNFSEKIKMGEKVMLKGESGCGKSTLCKLINRTYNLNYGDILVNDRSILDYNLKTIKANIIYVGQKESLYTDTIKNNIMFNCNDEEKFKHVCKICLIDKIVSQRKFRYDFGISNDSSNISGGEKQRIILARALMRNFEILILDEALSETDYFMEKQIIKNILDNFKDKTIIYVSHKKQDDLFERVIKIGGNND